MRQQYLALVRLHTETTQPLQVAVAGQSGVDVTVDARGFRFEQHKNKFGREYDRSGRNRY